MSARSNDSGLSSHSSTTTTSTKSAIRTKRTPSEHRRSLTTSTRKRVTAHRRVNSASRVPSRSKSRGSTGTPKRRGRVRSKSRELTGSRRMHSRSKSGEARSSSKSRLSKSREPKRSKSKDAAKRARTRDASTVVPASEMDRKTAREQRRQRRLTNRNNKHVTPSGSTPKKERRKLSRKPLSSRNSSIISVSSVTPDGLDERRHSITDDLLSAEGSPMIKRGMAGKLATAKARMELERIAAVSLEKVREQAHAREAALKAQLDKYKTLVAKGLEHNRELIEKQKEDSDKHREQFEQLQAQKDQEVAEAAADPPKNDEDNLVDVDFKDIILRKNTCISQLEDRCRRQDELVSALESEVAMYKKKLEAAEEEQNKFHEMLKSYQESQSKRTAQLINELSNAQAQIHTLEDELEEAEEDRVDLEDDCNNLKIQLAAAHSYGSSMDVKFASAEQRIATLQQQLFRLSNTVANAGIDSGAADQMDFARTLDLPPSQARSADVSPALSQRPPLTPNTRRNLRRGGTQGRFRRRTASLGRSRSGPNITLEAYRNHAQRQDAQLQKDLVISMPVRSSQDQADGSPVIQDEETRQEGAEHSVSSLHSARSAGSEQLAAC